MKKFLFGIAAVPFLASVAFAGQPNLLSDVQMDKVTAGLIEINLPFAEVLILQPSGPVCNVCVQLPGSDPHTVAFGNPIGLLVGPAANFENPNSFDLVGIPGGGPLRRQ
jgi:hypothetical protein